MAGVQQVAVSIAEAVQECRREARRAGKAGHPVEATVLERIATLLSTPVDWAKNMELAQELCDWLPFVDELADVSTMERKAWRTTFIMRLEIAREIKKRMIRQVTEIRGRPESIRRLAIYAMELRRQGKSWNEVANSLPCDWTNVANRANSIRCQVFLLKRALERCGVALEYRSCQQS